MNNAKDTRSEEFDRRDTRSLVPCVLLHALNRLPARCAMAKRGMQMLEQRLRDMYAELLVQVLQQSFEMVGRDHHPSGAPCWPLTEEILL